ncbi:hypothetical protein AGMMS49579_08090 [Spirochaetia bacterium]|nr:hypothetical protein AGMMS49579_08090 [Spirochaetia bacterium]
MTDIDRVIEEAKAAVMPFESWERLTGESGAAYSAFCAYRDFGPERNIRKAVDAAEPDSGKRDKRYRVWRNWSTAFRWRERAAEYDRYTEKLKQAEMRKNLEAQGEKYRAATGKILDLVIKKIDTMNPVDLSQGNVPVYLETAAKVDRDIDERLGGNEGKVADAGKQGQLLFGPEFEGL